MNQTKYRIVNSNGINSYLEYETEEKFLWWKYPVWKRVWKPYYDNFYGRDTTFDWDVFVNSLNCNFNEFIKKWPDISEYFKWANVEQTRLENNAKKFHQELESKKGIKYLN